MILISRCRQCDRACFPAPLLCRACGGADFASLEVADGIIEQMTRVESTPAVLIGSVRVHEDVVVIAALPPSEAWEPGARIGVTGQSGATEAAYVPGGENRGEQTS